MFNLIRTGCSLVCLSLLLMQSEACWSQTVKLAPMPQASQGDVQRFGLNLGGSSTWGAEQLMSNIVKNPGFEGTQDRTLIVIKEINHHTIVDDTPWLARDKDFWTGGEFHVLTGAAAGKSGSIIESDRQGKKGPAYLSLDPLPNGLTVGDAVSIANATPANGVAMWWIGAGRVHTTTSDRRPGSPGKQSAHLLASNGQRSALHHYFDTIGNRAGKLLVLTGKWKLSFWARGNGLKDSLDVSVLRAGSPKFLKEKIELKAQWTKYEFSFSPQDIGPANPLSLNFEVMSGDVYIDDVILSEFDSDPSGFRHSVVKILQQLRPGYLRDWQGQLGDSLSNRMAEPFARHPNRYRPGDAEQLYLYSLPEFFTLCAAVGAQPWVIAPPLLNDSEWFALGKILASAAEQYQFREILLEFGNENWNTIFRPAGFLGERPQAQASDRAFQLVRSGAGKFQRLIPIVNAQFVNRESWSQLDRHSKHAARIAVAPYFLHVMNKMSAIEAVDAAFTDLAPEVALAIQSIEKRGKKIAVYEVNFHTTVGNASGAERNAVVTGAHAGPALAKRLLQTMLVGVREQAVYSLAGYDSFADDRSLVRLWGVMRDLAPGQMRPTGLALAMLNSITSGTLFASACTPIDTQHCHKLTAAWFQERDKTHLAVVSAAAQTTRIQTNLPCHRRMTIAILDGSRSTLHNENSHSPQVFVEIPRPKCVGQWQFDLPAHSFAILTENFFIAPPSSFQESSP